MKKIGLFPFSYTHNTEREERKNKNGGNNSGVCVKQPNGTITR